MPPEFITDEPATERLPRETMRDIVFPEARHLPSCVRFSGYAGTEGDCSCGMA